MAPLRIYAASRLLTLLTAMIVAVVRRDMGVVDFLSKWDGGWFLAVVRDGYPTEVPVVGGVVSESTIPFFPLYPLVTRFVSWLLPVSEPVAGILVSLTAGAAAVLALHRLALMVTGRDAADRAVALFCFFPGSMVLSMAYSEGLMVALTAWCLVALMERRWLVAGVCAGLATASRASALVLVIACVWQAAVAIRQRQEWQALVAPALAPAGIATYFAYLWARTGEPLAYLHAQEAWGVAPGFARATRVMTIRFLQAPFDAPVPTITTLTLAFAIVAAVMLLLRRWPTLLAIYAVSMIAMSVAARDIRPRDVLTALPLFIALGAMTQGARFRVTRLLFAGGMMLSLVFHNLGPWAQP